jgi:hypothetical protein
MTVQLSDAMWGQLDPSAARVSPRARRRLTAAALTLTMLVLAGTLIDQSGVATPRIANEGGWGGPFRWRRTPELQANRDTRPVSPRVGQSFTIVNKGWFPLKIVGVDVDRSGMRVERVAVGRTHFDSDRGMWRVGGRTLTPSDPHVLPPGENVYVQVYYHVTDCHAVTASPQPVPVHLQRWFGRQSVDIVLPPLRPYRKGGYSVSTPDDAAAVQWQRFIADYVCGFPSPDGL